jgi:DNA-binding response OmpR family regulator
VYKVFLLATHLDDASPLHEAVKQAGFSCLSGTELPFLEEPSDSGVKTDAVIIDLVSISNEWARGVIDECRDARVPVLTVVFNEDLEEFDTSLNPDEILFCPFGPAELTARVKLAIFRVHGPSGSKLLRSGDLTIDLERYEVTVAGRKVSLTYKEFQLLVLLASNPGRVYTRDALLSQIWGYDYLGGTRTVDVHVRRLRSKVEAPGRSFVETIRNVGYRFTSSS